MYATAGTYDNSKKGQPFKSTGGANGRYSSYSITEIITPSSASKSHTLSLNTPLYTNYYCFCCSSRALSFCSIRFEPEIKHGANAGLSKGLTLLEPIKAQYPKVSWADLIQLASAVAVEHAGGPRIAMKYGRVDASGPDECPKVSLVTLLLLLLCL
jgi:Peroxidase